MLMTDEQAKKDKDDKKQKEAPELKEELTEDELSEVSGGKDFFGPTHPLMHRGFP